PMAALAGIGFFGFLRLARRHFGMAQPAAAMGAVLFVFANMISVGLIHAQIFCAMLLPLLCDLALTAWGEPRPRRAVALAALAGLLYGLIFLTAYQTAWFFTFLLLLCAVLYPAVFGLAPGRELLHDAMNKSGRLAGYAAGFALGAVPFLLLYLPVLLSGRHRELAEVFGNSPDARDIINVSTGNWLWGDFLQHAGITGRPNRPIWEAERGLTPAVFMMLLATMAMLFARRRLADEPVATDRWLLLLGLAALLSWLLQLEYFGIRLWAAVWALVPGASAIRYTFRLQFVANLFVALVVAHGLSWLWLLAREKRRHAALVVVAACVLLVEQVNVDWPATLSRRDTQAWIDAVPAPPSGCRVFYLVPRAEPVDKQGWIHQADAMLFAQARGIPTVNGYSSWLPEHWALEEPAKPGYAEAVRDWAQRNGMSEGLCGLEPRRGRWTVGLP
ncbi:MAG: hypothetical protein HY244_11310, partial [Rhizobiales bacterium]|nr:hypothetical protein [Hyphomicrobiales bacterium]